MLLTTQPSNPQIFKEIFKNSVFRKYTNPNPHKGEAKGLQVQDFPTYINEFHTSFGYKDSVKMNFKKDLSRPAFNTKAHNKTFLKIIFQLGRWVCHRDR